MHYICLLCVYTETVIFTKITQQIMNTILSQLQRQQTKNQHLSKCLLGQMKTWLYLFLVTEFGSEISQLS